MALLRARDVLRSAIARMVSRQLDLALDRGIYNRNAHRQSELVALLLQVE
jgi:hypothetical protein